eukprot:71500-Prymnesium_polylepis.1
MLQQAIAWKPPSTATARVDAEIVFACLYLTRGNTAILCAMRVTAKLANRKVCAREYFAR